MGIDVGDASSAEGELEVDGVPWVLVRADVARIGRGRLADEEDVCTGGEPANSLAQSV